MQNRNLLPFFWPKLVAPAVFISALASGCAAGEGVLEGRAGDVPGSGASSAPSSPTPTTATTPPTLNGSAPAATSNPSVISPVTPVANAAANSPNGEAVPTPERDEEALPAEQQGGDGAGEEEAGEDEVAPTPGTDDGDDGSADNGGDDDDDDDDGGDDDDGDDDDNGGDDDGDDGDDGDDDGAGAGVTPPANPGNPPPAPDAITFTADVRTILVANCGRCHASGGLPQFASTNAATGYDVAFRERGEIVSEIRSGNMPADTCDGAPGSNGCVSVADFNLISQWVAAGAPE